MGVTMPRGWVREVVLTIALGTLALALAAWLYPLGD